jgi:hypothetical protein
MHAGFWQRLAGLALASILSLSGALYAYPSSPGGSRLAPAAPGSVTLEDFSDMVTTRDGGVNDFSGNMGIVNANYASSTLVCSQASSCGLRFDWDFGQDTQGFTGIFASLFGLSETMVTFDGTSTQTLAFPEHTLDLDRVDGTLAEPGGARRFLELCTRLVYTQAQELSLRLELKDPLGGVRFTRLAVPGSSAPQNFCWNFRAPPAYQIPPGRSDLNLHQAKELTFIVERRHEADEVENPPSGKLTFQRIWFVSDREESRPAAGQAQFDLLERRVFQYFLDWTSRKTASAGLPQDRSTFGDLLTTGGIGFSLPAYVIAAQRGWITRAEAASRTLGVLRILDNESAFGPQRVGRIGYRGWFYHFLGVDGRRKMNFDFPDTPVDERRNTVELSTIDTGLAMLGVLAAQSYFDDPDRQSEIEIRTRAQSIYDRVDWPFMLEATRNQFYLGWKPNEDRDPPAFEIPDLDQNGAFSGTPGHPATLDYYTDEALIVILLAAGSETHPVPASVYASLAFARDDQGLIRTYPGSLFTYQFLHAFLDTRRPAPRVLPVRPVSWYANSRQAIFTAIQYAAENPLEFPTYGPFAWGSSAAEGPDDLYHAYGLPPLALNPSPEQDGTVTYYAMMCGAGYGEDLKEEAASVLDRAWQRGHWHPRFGLPDAFHDDVARVDFNGISTVRASGPWVNRALFAIDQGPMLLCLENARSGLVWGLIGRNPNIRRGLHRLDWYYHIFLPAAIR